MIRHLVSWSTAVALIAAAGCSKAIGSNPRRRRIRICPARGAPLGDREVGGMPPVNAIPLTPWAAAKLKAERPAAGENQDFANRPIRRLKYATRTATRASRCIRCAFKLIQTDDYLYQLWEYNQNWRQIALNKPHEPDPALTWYGDAVGKWDGDALVVDQSATRIRRGSTREACRTHRISTSSSASHRAGENLIVDFTFEDPGAFTKPWSATLTYKPAPMER